MPFSVAASDRKVAARAAAEKKERKAIMRMRFAKFPELPTELQLKVWSYAIDEIDEKWGNPNPDYHTFYSPYTHGTFTRFLEGGGAWNGFNRARVLPIANLMQACKLSRQMVLDHFLKSMLEGKRKMLQNAREIKNCESVAEYRELLIQQLEELSAQSGKP